MGGINKKILTTHNLDSENSNTKKGSFNNRTSVNFGVGDLGFTQKGHQNYIDDLILEEEEMDLSEDETDKKELLINETQDPKNKSEEENNKNVDPESRADLKLQKMGESGLEGIKEMEEESTPRSGLNDPDDKIENTQKSEETKNVEPENNSEEVTPTQSNEIKKEDKISDSPEDTENNKETIKSENEKQEEKETAKISEKPEDQKEELELTEEGLQVSQPSPTESTSVNAEESSLQPTFKLKIAGRSMQMDQVEEEFKFGMLSGNDNLTYNQDFFVKKQEEERTLMYSGAARLSIKKVLHKLENKILGQLTKRYEQV